MDLVDLAELVGVDRRGGRRGVEQYSEPAAYSSRVERLPACSYSSSSGAAKYMSLWVRDENWSFRSALPLVPIFVVWLSDFDV